MLEKHGLVFIIRRSMRGADTRSAAEKAVAAENGPITVAVLTELEVVKKTTDAAVQVFRSTS